jgi:putative hydrolase of HD superfamily
MNQLFPFLNNPRLSQQLAFLVEADKVKQIIRKTKLFDQSRRENDAEHSWTLSLMAIVLEEYAHEPVDILKVIKMLLIHDLVEIDAGDTFLYAAERADTYQTELAAAQRIFGMISGEVGEEFLNLWIEFEGGESPEARYAKALDRLEPLLQNYFNRGSSWVEHGITYPMVLKMNEHTAKGSPDLWAFVEQLLEECMAQGFLPRS